ncbi:UNVERIFIED_CONTAM: hypothetical protein RMT77_017373 [Armadillidium vulgare]
MSTLILPMLFLALFCAAEGQLFAPSPQGTGPCADTNALCPRWALEGECYHNRGYMAVYCPKSCDQCNVFDPICRDHDIQCAAWADKGECTRNKKFMSKTCAKSCSVCLPARDHSVPHLRSNIIQEFWETNELNINPFERRQ